MFLFQLDEDSDDDRLPPYHDDDSDEDGPKLNVSRLGKSFRMEVMDDF